MKNFRPVWVEIDLSNLRFNINSIKKILKPSTGIIAIVKTNAYGHGIRQISEACFKEGIKFFGVSSIEEGIILRRAGIKGEILILGSLYPFENFKTTIKYGLIPTIASIDGLIALDYYSKKLKTRTSFHLEVDTGMGRTGICEKSVPVFLTKLENLKNANLTGVYTHFASADYNSSYTLQQISTFDRIRKMLVEKDYKKIIFHCANSAGILKYRQSHYDMVRPGLLLYGLLPYKNVEKDISIKPVLSWKTMVVYLKKVKKGSSISYANTFITKRDSLIATLPVGYGDGYSRTLSNRGYVLIHGSKAPITGRVTMDMMMVDVTDIPGVKVGDEVVLIGQQGKEVITTEKVAEISGTINYEVVCNINHRVQRVYLNG